MIIMMIMTIILMVAIVMIMWKLSITPLSFLFNYTVPSPKVSIFLMSCLHSGFTNSCPWITIFLCTFTLHIILLHLALLINFLLDILFLCGFQNNLLTLRGSLRKQAPSLPLHPLLCLLQVNLCTFYLPKGGHFSTCRPQFLFFQTSNWLPGCSE